MCLSSGSNADIIKETFWGKVNLDINGISDGTITILWMSLPTNNNNIMHIYNMKHACLAYKGFQQRIQQEDKMGTYPCPTQI